jgi:hypothetical protein
MLSLNQSKQRTVFYENSPLIFSTGIVFLRTYMLSCKQSLRYLFSRKVYSWCAMSRATGLTLPVTLVSLIHAMLPAGLFHHG